MGSDGIRQGVDWTAVADAIRGRIEQQRITQLELASKAGVSLATVQELVKPLPRKRQPRTLAAVSVALGWPEDRLQEILHGRASAVREPADTGDEDIRVELRAIHEELARITRRLDALEAEPEDGR